MQKWKKVALKRKWCLYVETSLKLNEKKKNWTNQNSYFDQNESKKAKKAKKDKMVCLTCEMPTKPFDNNFFTLDKK